MNASVQEEALHRATAHVRSMEQLPCSQLKLLICYYYRVLGTRQVIAAPVALPVLGAVEAVWSSSVDNIFSSCGFTCFLL